MYKLPQGIHAAAGKDPAEFRPHSPRVGGETAYANSPEDDELVDVLMVLFRSKAGQGYLQPGKVWLERTVVAIGRKLGAECAGIPVSVTA